MVSCDNPTCENFDANLMLIDYNDWRPCCEAAVEKVDDAHYQRWHVSQQQRLTFPQLYRVDLARGELLEQER